MDANEFAERYGRIYRDLYRFALCLMGSAADAEDAVGEAVLAAWEKRGQLRRDEAFKSWLFQITANTCRRKLKRDGRMVPAEPEAMEPPDRPQLDQADAAAVRQTFACLNEEDRLIVGLSVFGGYRSREIGSLLQMNPSTVRSRRKRALDQMGRRLEGGAR